LEAVYELTKEQPGGHTNPAFRDIAALRDKVEQLKCEAARKRIDQLRRDLELLKGSNEAAFKEKLEALRALVPR
jgi:hypothetical protein